MKSAMSESQAPGSMREDDGVTVAPELVDRRNKGGVSAHQDRRMVPA